MDHTEDLCNSIVQNQVDFHEDINQVISELKTMYYEDEQLFRQKKNEVIEVSDDIKGLTKALKIYEIELNNGQDVFYPNEKESQYLVDKMNSLKEEIEFKEDLEKEKLEYRDLLKENAIKWNHMIILLDGLKSKYDLCNNMLHSYISLDVSKKHANDMMDGIHILDSQEKDRQRIAREMHDGPVQNLTSIVHKSEFCAKIIDKDIIRAKLELQGMTNSCRTIINEMRGIIYNLRPMSIDDLGLIPTLEKMILIKKHEYDVDIHFKVINEEYKVKNIVNLTLFRIIDEALNNCIRYSQSDTIELIVTFDDECIEILIRDNGIGFDVSQYNESKDNKNHLGLSIMRERVNILMGELEIKSECNIGTEYFVKVPIKKYKEVSL